MSIPVALDYAKQAVEADSTKQYSRALVLYNKAILELKSAVLSKPNNNLFLVRMSVQLTN